VRQVGSCYCNNSAKARCQS